MRVIPRESMAETNRLLPGWVSILEGEEMVLEFHDKANLRRNTE